MSTYQKSLIARLEKFFADNPDEELTYGDIAVKFGVPISSAYSRVSEAVKAGADFEVVSIIRAKGV